MYNEQQENVRKYENIFMSITILFKEKHEKIYFCHST